MTAMQRLRRKRRAAEVCIECGGKIQGPGTRCSDCRTRKNLNFQRNYSLNRLQTLVLEKVITYNDIMNILRTARNTERISSR